MVSSIVFHSWFCSFASTPRFFFHMELAAIAMRWWIHGVIEQIKDSGWLIKPGFVQQFFRFGNPFFRGQLA
jgi:hypothetical protein